MEELKGVIGAVVFRNDENGWTVLELAVDNGGKSALITAVGVTPAAAPGMDVTLSGEWVDHRDYGRQFKFSYIQMNRPEGEDAIERYLASGLIRGVREATARNIVRAFGADTLRVIEQEPERLAEVKGISMARAMEISESYALHSAMRDIVMGLSEYGITANQAVKLYRQYGDRTLTVVTTDPYSLVDDIEGIGFVTADRIARKVGIAFDSPFRISAGIKHALSRAASDGGHTCLPADRLVAFAADMLGCEESDVEDQLYELILKHKLYARRISGQDLVFLPAFWTFESEIANMLLELAELSGQGLPIDAPAELRALERATGKVLDDAQREAVLAAVDCGVMVVTGGPGTGKTTIMQFVLALMDKMGFRVELCAPTGRAAKRLSEAAGREARTIHRLLEYNGDFFFKNDEDPLDADVFIVDEASMIDAMLMYRLLLALPDGARLLLVGDADQLPSVGAGNVLRDIINSGKFPVFRLNRIFRQSGRSRIAENAALINAGKLPLLDYTEDFAFEPRPVQEDVQRRVVDICKNGRLGDVWTDLQVLSPTKKGPLGVHSLNKLLQDALNPKDRAKAEMTYGETLFRVGDKVMQIKNNYKMEWTRPTLSGEPDGCGVFNGDIGTIMAIHQRDKLVEVLFDDERTAFYTFGEMGELELAYCISIHKSQGSEFPVVLLPLCGGPPQLMTRNLLYTAITRARNRAVIIGRPSTLSYMVENDHEQTRYSALKGLLEQGC
ncbi:MAG: ATP-dependent RecD-like DNA helicase [Christensenellales bacterium]|jgi:exodeoxyribonuclease V alpha subunit